MFDKDLIIINKIEPIYDINTFIGEEPKFKQVGLKVKFSYKKMNMEIDLDTENIYGNEIKDLIEEQLLY